MISISWQDDTNKWQKLDMQSLRGQTVRTALYLFANRQVVAEVVYETQNRRYYVCGTQALADIYKRKGFKSFLFADLIRNLPEETLSKEISHPQEDLLPEIAPNLVVKTTQEASQPVQEAIKKETNTSIATEEENTPEVAVEQETFQWL